jgi:hypothetical protein
MDKQDNKLDERELSSSEMKDRERIVKGLKKSYKDFKSRYGERAKSVMYATATKMAKEEVEDLDEAIKPYVSGDHASGWDVLDHTGKTVKTFHHRDYADHPIPNKKKAAYDDAVAYLHKNFKKLSKPVSEEAEQIDESDRIPSVYQKDGAAGTYHIKYIGSDKDGNKESKVYKLKANDHHHAQFKALKIARSDFPHHEKRTSETLKFVKEGADLDESILTPSPLTSYRKYIQAARNAREKGDHDIAKDAEEKAKRHAASYKRVTGKDPTMIGEDAEVIEESMIDRDDFDDRVASAKKSGWKVLDHKYTDSKAHISFVDGEGTHRSIHYAPTGKSMKNHGPYEGGMKDDSGEKVNKGEVKTVKRGRGRPRKDKFAEAVDILMALPEDEFDSLLEDNSLDELVEIISNLDEQEIKKIRGE